MKTLSNELFEDIVAKIDDSIPFGNDSKKAIIYGVMLNESNDIQFEIVEAGSDVYELLESVKLDSFKLKEYDIFTLATCGWAAPIKTDDDGNTDNEDNQIAPSQHPEKRRVRLLCNATVNDQIGSSINFEDDPKNPIFDFGQAKGALSEALLELIESLKN